MTTEELERAVDATLPTGCGGCGRSLPQPGTQCPECGVWPDITRQEQAALLSAPGELTLHRADEAETRVLELMRAFQAAAAVPDRLRKQAEVEQAQAEVQQVLGQVGQEHAEAIRRLREAEEAETGPKARLDQCVEKYQAAQAALEKAERTLAGPEAEINARRDIAAIQPVLDKYQRLYDQAAAETASRRLDVEQCELVTSLAEQARDEQATRLLHLEEVRPSARRLTLLAHPLVAYVDELVRDQESETPQYPDEWGNVLALLHHLAGAAGLLAMAEEGAAPRVLENLMGPLSRADEAVALQRRLGGSQLLLPPAPGTASMTYLGNQAP